MNVSSFSPMSSQNVCKNHPFILIIAQIYTIWMLFQKSSISGEWIKVKNRSTACSLHSATPAHTEEAAVQEHQLTESQHNRPSKSGCNMSRTQRTGQQQLVAMRYCHGCQAKQATLKYEQQTQCSLQPHLCTSPCVEVIPHSTYTLSISVQELLSN